MRAVGIVAEYNPFHSGHGYHIEETRRLMGPVPVIAVMSGDFVQRGEAAVFDKHTRAGAAVLGGADLVIELPLPWALSSAEGFARGAVGLLWATGVVGALSFGSESGDVRRLAEAAGLLDSDGLRVLMLEKLRTGVSYPAARQAALAQLSPESSAVLETPNDILGVEYIRAMRALGADMKPLAVVRRGAGHDEDSDGELRSASQLRKMLRSGEDWLSFVPEAVRPAFAGAGPVDPDRLECAVLSRLRMLGGSDFAALPDASEGLDRRLHSAVLEGGSLEEVLALAASKRYPMSRLRRMLMCAALGIRRGMNSGTPGYIRVLAASRTGLSLLSEMRSSAAVPVITKPAHGRRLTGKALECFELCAAARDLYVLGLTDRRGGADLRTGPHIIK